MDSSRNWGLQRHLVGAQKPEVASVWLGLKLCGAGVSSRRLSRGDGHRLAGDLSRCSRRDSGEGNVCDGEDVPEEGTQQSRCERAQVWVASRRSAGSTRFCVPSHMVPTPPDASVRKK